MPASLADPAAVTSTHALEYAWVLITIIWLGSPLWWLNHLIPLFPSLILRAVRLMDGDSMIECTHMKGSPYPSTKKRARPSSQIENADGLMNWDEKSMYRHCVMLDTRPGSLAEVCETLGMAEAVGLIVHSNTTRRTLETNRLAVCCVEVSPVAFVRLKQARRITLYSVPNVLLALKRCVVVMILSPIAIFIGLFVLNMELEFVWLSLGLFSIVCAGLKIKRGMAPASALLISVILVSVYFV